MRNYDKIISQLAKDLEKGHNDCDLLKDKICVVRLEQRAIHFLIDSETKELSSIALSSLINIFMSEFPHKDWDECIKLLQKRKPEWW